MQTPMRRLDRGERAPDFVLPCQDGTPTRFYAKAGGRPTVLLFCATGAGDELLRLAQVFNNRAGGAVALFAVTGDGTTMNPPVPIFSDPQGAVRAAYGLNVADQTTLFVLDPNLRVLVSLSLQANAGSTAHQVMACLAAALPSVAPLEIAHQAPVLLIPQVLDPESCQELVNVWETQGNVATGVEQLRGGRYEDTLSPDIKCRRDHTVMEETFLRRLSSTIGRRVMPEIHKAFAFRATHFEGFKIACYDAAAGGFFGPHRDNLSPATAHRRFALSLNLNAGYEGGYLRFPEYGPHLYCPDTGSALVFSCSHLHEVMAVTQGRRFVLLSFLFSEADSSTSRAPSTDRSSPPQR